MFYLIVLNSLFLAQNGGCEESASALCLQYSPDYCFAANMPRKDMTPQSPKHG